MGRSWARLVGITAGITAGAVAAAVALGASPAQADWSAPPCPRSVSVNDVTAYEGTVTEDYVLFRYKAFTFTVSSGGCAAAGTVSYQTVHGTTEDIDYLAKSGTLSFQAGDGAAQRITVSVWMDRAPGPDEYFYLLLSDASPAASIEVADRQGIATIVNDDEFCAPGGGDYHCME
jgi:Calx-beta domain